jgi:hypothetical protein
MGHFVISLFIISPFWLCTQITMQLYVVLCFQCISVTVASLFRSQFLIVQL